MIDADRDLINKVLEAAGHAGTKGFEYMVHYQIVDGITGILGCLLVLGLLAVGLHKAFAWKIKEGYDADLVHIVRGAVIAAISIAVFITVISLPESLTKIMAPEGAAIKSVVK